MDKESSSSNANPPAGLAFAPNYDASQEMDPKQAEEIQPEGFDVHKLAYYQELERQRNFKIRAGLLAVVFAMILANMWMVQSNQDSLADANSQMNAQLNQATKDRSVIVDQLELSDMSQHLNAISERLERIETHLGVQVEAVNPEG